MKNSKNITKKLGIILGILIILISIGLNVYYYSQTKKGELNRTSTDNSIKEKKISSDAKLDAAQAILSAVQWTHTFTIIMITVVVTILGFLGVKVIFPILITSQIKKWVKDSEELKKIKSDIEESSIEMNIALAQSYKDEGLDRYREGAVNRAIELTERSASFFKKAFPTELPQTKDEVILWGTICGNLAYYYAEGKNHAKYAEALDYSKVALSIGKKHNVLNLIEDFLYVVKNYNIKHDRTREEAKKILNNYKDDFLKANILNEDDVKKYETYCSEED